VGKKRRLGHVYAKKHAEHFGTDILGSIPDRDNVRDPIAMVWVLSKPKIQLHLPPFRGFLEQGDAVYSGAIFQNWNFIFQKNKRVTSLKHVTLCFYY